MNDLGEVVWVGEGPEPVSDVDELLVGGILPEVEVSG